MLSFMKYFIQDPGRVGNLIFVVILFFSPAIMTFRYKFASCSVLGIAFFVNSYCIWHCKLSKKSVVASLTGKQVLFPVN